MYKSESKINNKLTQNTNDNYASWRHVDGDADAAVEARIRIGWNKFRQLVPLLTNKDVSLTMDRNIVQQLCAKQYVAWKWDLACKERKCGGTSASRDENGQVDVWH